MEPGGVAIVTGGNRGIGRAVVVELARRGFDVLAGARAPGQVAPFPDGTAGSITAVALDVCRLEGWTAPARVRVLVNNAGLDGAYLPIEHADMDDWRRLFETNVFGLVDMTRRIIPAMRAAGGGVIVNMTSASLPVPMPLYGAYRASKAAVAAMSETLETELSDAGIRVLEVMPGPVATDMLATSDRMPEAASLPDYAGMAQALWDGRRSIESFVTPPEVAARHIVAAVLDDDTRGRVACDELGADLTGAPLLS